MDTKTLLELRKKAEKAVGDMSDGPLKVKAFEVILANLLTGPQEPVSQAAQQRREQEQLKEAPAKTLTARILVLKDEGFFWDAAGNQPYTRRTGSTWLALVKKADLDRLHQSIRSGIEEMARNL